MRSVLLTLGLLTSACAHGSATTNAPTHPAKPAPMQTEASATPQEGSAGVAVVSFCLETEGQPSTPVLYVQEGLDAKLEMATDEHTSTLGVRISSPSDNPEGQPRLTVSHHRDEQLLSEDEVAFTIGVPVRVGKDGPIAQVNSFASKKELRVWHEAGGAGLATSSGCVAG